jgi:hypothetical protein
MSRDQVISFNDSRVGRGWFLIVLCRFFGDCIWFTCSRRIAERPMCSGCTGSECAWGPSFAGRRSGLACTHPAPA